MWSAADLKEGEAPTAVTCTLQVVRAAWAGADAALTACLLLAYAALLIRFVAVHGGVVQLERNAQGGTTVTVLLPAKPA